MYFILGIIAIGVLIIVHELGHFIMAKVNGVFVEEFSIGMGPKIYSYEGKETKYSLGLFPVGGYVKMRGEEESSDDERSFSQKSPLRRITIIVAGAVMNFLLAIIIFAVTLYTAGYKLPQANTVIENSPAFEAGIKEGDIFKKAAGSRVITADDLTLEIAMSKGNPIDFVILRDGEEKNITITPRYNEEEKRYMIGFSFEVIENPSIMQSISQSFKQTGTLVMQTFKGLKMLVTGQANLKTDVGGPVTIIRMSGEAAKSGMGSLLYFIGFISVNLAVFNLLPFPALDGGWTIILLIELITRRKVPEKIVQGINYVGFAFLIGLMVLVTVKDVIFPIKL